MSASPHRGSLRTRIAVGFTLAFALFAATACGAFFLWARYEAHRDAEERAAAAARHLAIEWKGGDAAKAFAEIHEDARLDAVSLLLVSDEGIVVGRDGHPLPWPLPKRGWILREVRTGSGFAVAGLASEPIAAELRSRAGALALFAALATVATGLAAWAVVGRTLRPIGRLADAASALSGERGDERLAPPSPDAEMVRLVATLNGMLARLGEQTRERGEFYASAAHELRTPLAALSAGVEVALSRPRTEAEYEATLRELQAQISRLGDLTEDLLTLNRLEADRGEGLRDVESLPDAVDRALASLAPEIEARGLGVAFRIERETEVVTLPNHLDIVVRNLLENAVRHSPARGRVEVLAGAGLTLANDAPDALPEDLERFFEPFVQGERSRSTVGNGLGLAISRRVVGLNGWSLQLRREGGRVVARLDCAPTEPPPRIPF